MEEIKIIKKSTFLGKEIDVYGTADEPLFKAKDVAVWIELTNVSDMVSRLDEDEVTKFNLGSLQGDTWFLTEDGLYEVLMQSRKPIAKQFKKGVKTILKEIRRTGSFASNAINQPTPRQERKESKLSEKIRAAKFIAKFLNLGDTAKLEIAKSIADPLGLPTPDYAKATDATNSVSVLLKKYEAKINAVDFNKLLIQHGFLTVLTRKSSHGREKTFKCITQKGLSYGENVVHPQNPNETQPRWYETKFKELMSIVTTKEEEK